MTLVELTYYARRVAIFTPFIFIFLLISYVFVLKVILPNENCIIPFLPCPKTAPGYNPVFGKIKPIDFTYKLDYPKNPRYKLENILGRPTTTTDSAKVFYIPTVKREFSSIQNIILKARRVGFNTDVEKYIIEDDIATFENNEQKLEINVNTYNFKYRYKYELFPEIFDNPSFPSDQLIREYARNFLSEMGTYYSQLARGSDNVIYLKYNSSLDTFEVVTTPDQANVVEVDFFRDKVDNLPIVSPKYHNSQNYVVMTFGPEGYSPIKAEVSYYEYNAANYGLYPIKNGYTAWDELINGHGIIVSANKNASDVIITEMYLAYYDPDNYQEYLQPIYVFIGEDRFTAYVPALVDEYIESQVTSNE